MFFYSEKRCSFLFFFERQYLWLKEHPVVPCANLCANTLFLILREEFRGGPRYEFPSRYRRGQTSGRASRMVHRPIRLGSRNSASPFWGLREESGGLSVFVCTEVTADHMVSRAAVTRPCSSSGSRVGPGSPFPKVFRTSLWTCGIAVHRARPPRRTDGFTLIRGFVEFPGSLSASPIRSDSERLPCKWHEFTRAVTRALLRFPSCGAMDRFYMRH